MKKIFLLLVLSIVLLSAYCLASEKHCQNKFNATYSIKILDKTFSCVNNNCYDFNSFRYNKLTKTFYVNTIMDLIRCNAHQEYLSPYGDGYISHLIFETKLHNDTISVKCKGFVVGDILVDYKNGRASSAHYNIISIHKGKPITIKNIKEFEDISLDKNDYISFIKNQVNNQAD